MKYTSYIILGQHETTRQFYGEVEYSFSMGIEKSRVRVYSSKYFGKSTKQEYYNWLKDEASKLSRKCPTIVFSVFRVGSKHCPVKIDWTEYNAMIAGNLKKDKSKFRNLPFSVKQNFTTHARSKNN